MAHEDGNRAAVFPACERQVGCPFNAFAIVQRKSHRPAMAIGERRFVDDLLCDRQVGHVCERFVQRRLEAELRDRNQFV